MKVLFFSHYFPPEVNAPATRTYEHAKEWVKAGADVTVITCAPNHPTGKLYPGYRNALWQSENKDGIKVIRVWTFLAGNRGVAKRIIGFISYMFSASIASLFVRKVDVIVATSPQFFCGWAGVISSRLKRRPLILEIRDLWPESIVTVGAIKNRTLIRLLEYFEVLMYRAANKVVTVGQGYHQQLLNRKVPAEKLTVIYNGVDPAEYQNLKHNPDCDKNYGLNSKYVCSYIGTIGMAHGLEIVLQVASSLKRQGHEQIKFLLVGEGAEREKLQQKADQMELDNIVFTGQLPRAAIKGILAASDCFLVHLKKTDLFSTVIPSKIFEMLAVGKPILMGVQGEAATIVEEAAGGVLFEPENATELEAKLLKLYQTASSSKVVTPRTAWQSKFSRITNAHKYLELINEVVTDSSSAKGSMHLLRYYRTIKHLKTKQIVWQILRRAQKILDRTQFVRNCYLKDHSKNILQTRLIEAPFKPTNKILSPNNGFTFLNLKQTLDRGEWFLANVPLLWMFNLHYFEYLQEIDDTAHVEQLITDWLGSVNACHPIAWHPAVISYRVPNWIYAYAKHQKSFSPDFKIKFINSLFNQLRYLSRRLEYNLLGNHLFTNGCALIVGGSFLEDDNFIKKGLAVLIPQLEEQILADGGHFERSTSYHILMMQHLIGAIESLQGTDFKNEQLINALSRLISFLESISVNGKPPLLNDSSYEMSHPPSTVLKKAKQILGNHYQPPISQNNETLLKDTGLFIYKSETLSYIFDCGPLGPDYLLGHAHNDTLTFLLTFGEHALITDAGVFEYQAGKWRNYFRSSKAHNVVTINDCEPNEIWKSFRVGHRGHPQYIDYRPGHYIEADDNAYSRHAVTLCRRIERSTSASGIIITDCIKNSSPKEITIESNLHFHPQAEVKAKTRSADQQTITIALNEQLYDLTVFDSEMSIVERHSFYSPEFGKKISRLNLALLLTSDKPETVLRYSVTKSG